MRMVHTNHKDVVSQTNQLVQGDRVPKLAQAEAWSNLQVYMIFSNLACQAMVALVT